MFPQKGLVRLMRTCAAEQASGYGDDKLSGALYGQPQGWPLSFLHSQAPDISAEVGRIQRGADEREARVSDVASQSV